MYKTSVNHYIPQPQCKYEAIDTHYWSVEVRNEGTDRVFLSLALTDMCPSVSGLVPSASFTWSYSIHFMFNQHKPAPTTAGIANSENIEPVRRHTLQWPFAFSLSDQ